MKNNRIALVTGASGVIGSAIAIMLASKQINVILHYYKNMERVKKVEEQCKYYGVNTLVIASDLSDIKQIEAMFQYLNRVEFFPDILVNNVGVAQYGLIQDVKFQDWKEVIDTNLISTFFCSQKVIPKMIQAKYGRIINISSVWGEKGAANEVVYSMSKGAINSFTKALAKELAPSGITVNAIAPGVVMSEMMVDFSEEDLINIKAQIPIGRFANPKEIAQTVLHLIHPNSSYITGQILTIDGGWS